jgi:hypothetical protein
MTAGGSQNNSGSLQTSSGSFSTDTLKMLDSDHIPIPMFPNALTTPLPEAPSMNLYTLYGGCGDGLRR